MIYYLLANNTAIQNSHIDQIDLDQNNVLILFNYMAPMKFDKIKNYSNKYVVCRLKADMGSDQLPYAGEELLGIYKDYFQKIFFHPSPQNIDFVYEGIHKKYIDDIKLDSYNIYNIEPYSNDLKQKVRYPRFQNMSTGFIVYNYIKTIKNESDKICLVGFTSEVSKYYHNPSWEAKFFRIQLANKQCELIW